MSGPQEQPWESEDGTFQQRLAVPWRQPGTRRRSDYEWHFLSSLLDNQGSRSLLAAPPTDSGRIRDDPEAPQNALLLAGGSWGPRGSGTGPPPRSRPEPLGLRPHRSPSRSFLNWVPMRQASSRPTRPLLFRGSATPPIQMSMLLGVPYWAISFLARSRFFRTVPSSPTVLGCGSPQKRLQALYPVWGEGRDARGWVPERPPSQHSEATY